MRKYFQLLLLFVLPLGLLAQTAPSVKGTVTDESGKAIAAATVSLLKSKDSTLYKAAVTDKNGEYEFVAVPAGSYRISVSSVGFGKTLSPAFTTADGQTSAPAIALSPLPKSLAGVVVTAQKPFIETKLDKTVVNVEASPTSAGATALDILEKSPGIMVDNDGNLSLRGKAGVIVLMDGKQTYLSAADLASLLKNMPASALDQIEIMTNPSSKYDATGNSGVINIKTKKGRNAGFNGSVMVGFTTSIYQLDGETLFLPKSQNSFNFNYRKNKLNFFGNYNPNFFKGRNTMLFDSRYLNGKYETTGYGTTETRFEFGNNNHTLKLGMDWYADKKNVLGVVVSGFTFQGHPTPTTRADLFDVNHQLTRRLVSKTDNELDFKNLTANLNWKHSFDSTGRELTADIDYVKYSNVSDMLLTTNYYNQALDYKGQTFLQGHLPADIDIYTLRSDLTLPVKNGRFEAGLKLSYVTNDNEVAYQNSADKQTWLRDTIRSNHFIYKENVNAAYVNLNQQWKKWTVQVGLRMENTNADGHQVAGNTSFTRNMTDLFPTAFVSYAASKNHSVTLNYGRRIQRPNYQDLNPFIFFLDTLSYRQGNIYLKPQYSHNIELTHAFKGKFITTLNYTRTNDIISQIIRPKNDSSLIRFLTVDNVSSQQNYGLSVTAPVAVARWWNLNLFANVFNNQYQGIYDTFRIDLAYTSFMVNLTNSFNFGKGFSAELSGFYRHKSLMGLSVFEPQYQMSIGLQQQVMKGAGTVRLNIRDPFAWQVFEGSNKYGPIDGRFTFRPDARQVTATFTWRFGGQSSNNQPRRRTSSSQDEQNRVGGAGNQ